MNPLQQWLGNFKIIILAISLAGIAVGLCDERVTPITNPTIEFVTSTKMARAVRAVRVYSDGTTVCDVIGRSKTNVYPQFEVFITVSNLSKLGFFDLNEGLIKNKIRDANAIANRTKGIAVADGKAVQLSVVRSNIVKKVTWDSLEVFLSAYPDIQELKILRQCVDLVEASFSMQK